MSVAEKDIAAFLVLGFLIDGEKVTEKTGSAFGHSRLAVDGPAHHVPLALANAASGYRVSTNIVRAWPASELDYFTGDPHVAVTPLIGDL